MTYLDQFKHENTPAYIIDLEKLNNRVNTLKEMIADTDYKLCYAMKANPFLVSFLKNQIDYFEVCSPGEFRICEKYGVDSSKIVLSGVYKDPIDIKYIVDKCGTNPLYTIESFNQFLLLSEIAKEKRLKLNVILRVTSGNQFGMDQEDIDRIFKENKDLTIKGIQYYSGTQKKFSKIEKEIKHLSELKKMMEFRYNCSLDLIEYGPGLGVNYYTKDDYIDEIQDYKNTIEQLKLEKLENVTLELGRFMVYDSASYVTKIVDVKCNQGVNYCMVDGGIHHLNYFGQMMAMRVPYIIHYPERPIMLPKKYQICGSLCTVSDVLVREIELKSVEVGDLLVFENVGAYSMTEGINLFLSRNLPSVYVLDENKELIKVREALETYKINSF